jgi:hypothetical protein
LKPQQLWYQKKDLEAAEAAAFLQEEPARKKRKEAEEAGDVNIPQTNKKVKFIQLLFVCSLRKV